MSRLEDETYALLKEVEQSTTTKKKSYLNYLSETPMSVSQDLSKERQNMADADPAKAAYDAAAFLPVSGEIISGKEGIEDFRQDNIGMGMLGVAGAIPLLGYGPRIAKGMLRSGGNVINQTVADMPTLVEGFYSGKPWNFIKDAVSEIPDALRIRTDATARTFQDIWGLSQVKVKDLFNQSKTAERMIKRGTPEDLAAAKKSGDDSEKTAMAIEAQSSPTIIPKEDRGALAQSVFALDMYDVGIDAADTARLASGIGNGNRLPDAPQIPDNVVSRFMTQLSTKGPHVDSKSNAVVEYQVKTLDASKGAGLVEGSGYKRGAPLIRAFNVGKRKGKTISPFLSYAKHIDKTGNISPIDTVEFTQLAATLDKDATKIINDLLPRVKKTIKGKTVAAKPELKTAVLLNRISRARANKRLGKPISLQQQEALNAFEEGVTTGTIKPRPVKDEAGNIVSDLDYDKIKTPEGAISAQQSTNSAQKELGGVNQMIIVDPYNQVNYSMLSDGHDIYGFNPINGHQLITAQPIVMQPWRQKGFVNQHRSNTTREQVAESVQEVERRIGRKAPIEVSGATGDNYVLAAKNWTKAMMLNPPKATKENTLLATQSKQKLGAVGAATTAGIGGGLLLSNSEE